MTVRIFKKVKTSFVQLVKADSCKERRPWVYLLTGVFLFMCIAYFSLLVQAIFNGVAHQDLENEIPRTNAHLQEKKFEYIYIRNSLNKDKAEELGLVVLNSESIEYITRDPVGFRGNRYTDGI